VDFSKAVQTHEKTQASYTAIILNIAARALAEDPIVNSSIEGHRIRVFEDVNVGVAIATEAGLVVPVIRNANRKSLNETDAAVKELTDKAKQGRLSKEDVTGGTFTITNLGMYGVDFFMPIINPPEAAILGVGRMVEKPVVLNGKVEVRPIVTLSLSYDHRIIDGAPAAKFLTSIKDRIENRIIEN
jgi:pyruvate dehydrogenase E2 component (dihydrolipoamide acetyltransferase)